MKKLFNLFATILAVSVLTIGFASCANDSSDSSSSSSSAASSSSSSSAAATALTTATTGAKAKFVYEGSTKDQEITTENAEPITKDLKDGLKVDLKDYIGKSVKTKNTYYYVFKDSEWSKVEYSLWSYEGKTVYEETTTDKKGTYTVTSGDFDNGTLVLKQTHSYSREKKTFEEVTSPDTTITIAGGKFTDTGDKKKREYTKQ